MPDPPLEYGERRRKDLALVRGYVAGNPACSDQLGERLASMARMVVHHNAKLGKPLGDEELREVTQSAVLALLRKIETYDGSAALETWASRFSFLELVRYLRDRRYRPRILPDGVEGSDCEPSSKDSHALLEAGEVLLALNELDQDISDAVCMKHLEGLTFEEISTRLETAESTVKSRYYAGMDKLRRRFARSGRALEGEVLG